MSALYPPHCLPAWWQHLIGPAVESWHRRTRPMAACPFVLLSWGRSGSTLLQRLLDQLPDVRCFGELLHNHQQQFPAAFGRPPYSLSHPSVSRARPAAAIDAILRLPSPRGILGWKLLIHQNDPCWDEVIRRPHVRKLVLVRENRLRQYLSLQLARTTSVWQVQDRREQEIYQSLKPGPLPVDADDFLATAARWEAEDRALQEALRQSGAPWLRVTYRDLPPPRRQETLGRIAAFLGASPSAPPQDDPVVRANPEPWETLVAHPEGLRRRLAATPCAWMLDDAPGG